MDLSVYYENFELSYILANFTVLLSLLVTVFLCVRRIFDKSEYCNQVRKKIGLCFLYVLYFAIILTYYFTGPYLEKKDIDQKTILCYEGEFEIVEVADGIFDKADFVVDGKQMRLTYSENYDYDIDLIKPGRYMGKLIYSKHSCKVLHIEVHESQ